MGDEGEIDSSIRSYEIKRECINLWLFGVSPIIFPLKGPYI